MNLQKFEANSTIWIPLTFGKLYIPIWKTWVKSNCSENQSQIWKVAAVILVFWIQSKSPEAALFCSVLLCSAFQQPIKIMLPLKHPVPLIITSTAVTFPLSQHPNNLSPHTSSSTCISWSLEVGAQMGTVTRKSFLFFSCLILCWSFHNPQRSETLYNYDHNEMLSGVQEHLEKQ